MLIRFREHLQNTSDYFSHRKQKIKINKMFSNWTNILHGALQGSILGPLLFNVLL